MNRLDRWQKIIPGVLLTLVAFAGSLHGQDFQQFASLYKNPADVKAGELTIRFESMGFFQNNEYLGNFVDGYTLPGALFRPKLTYSPTDDLYIEVGGHLVKYSGLDKPVNLVPWFSARYRFSDQFSVVTGNLDQNNEHGLLDQLWEPERIYTDRPESGLQFLYSSNRLNAQTWVSWEQFLQRNDPFQEHFTAGLTGDLTAYRHSAVSVKLPVQLLFYHQGGEINYGPSRPRVQTHANIAAGWELALNTGGDRLKSINLNGYWLGYKAITQESNTLPFGKGHAYLLEASAQMRHSLISLSYWNAYQFIAPKGRLLYQSISDSDPTFTQTDRSVVTAKYLWQKSIAKDARVAFKLEGFIDVPTGDFSYSYGFYLLLNQDFLLSTLKH
ncbi:MAG TPA: hypothetical protein DCL77_12695 [Prolixibacteraceae bacterium]|jgi:hypothetical protein|nr:hypothetical protein [Prolixibacteraceae bacterium]